VPDAARMITSTSRLLVPFATAAFVGCAVIQVFLAGRGVFEDPALFAVHRAFGDLFGWLIIVALILALIGRAPRRVTLLCVLLVVQFTLQSILAGLRGDMPTLAALHPLNGFGILLVGIVLTRRAWAARRA
jgi:hypothetical protein